MRYMLDANAFILLLTGHPEVLTRARQCAEGEIVLSAVAYAEVAHGSENGKPPSPAVLRRVETRFPILPFDRAAAASYARLPFKRGSYDHLIAAHAISLDLTLVTANLGDFARMVGLKFESWVE